jgi:ATP-binding cassette subfamily B protein
LCIGRLGRLIHRKTARIDPVCFEDPALLDDIEKAEQGMNSSASMVMVTIIVFTFYLPYFIFMGTYLYTLAPVLLLTIPLVFVPVLLTQFLRTKVFATLEDESAPIRREAEHYEKAICDRDFFKETGCSGLFTSLQRYTTRLFTCSTGKKAGRRCGPTSSNSACGW